MSKTLQIQQIKSSIGYKSKAKATLVALGNNKEKLTCVSADVISLTYDQGILIATRGYSQDLLSLKYLNPTDLFGNAVPTSRAITQIIGFQNNSSQSVDAADAAFCKAQRTTLKGSMIP